MKEKTRRIFHHIGIGLAALMLLFAAASVYLLFFHDWRGSLSRMASEKSGRLIALDGDLYVDWARQTEIRLAGISVANMQTGSAEQMFSAEQINFKIDLWELLKSNIVMPELRLEKPKLLLEKDADGNSNWSFTDNPAGAVASSVAPDERGEFPAIGRLIIHEGSLQYKDPKEHTDITLKTSTATGKAGENDQIEFSGKGSYNQKSFALNMRGASVIALRDTDDPYPLKADVTIGNTSGTIEGTVLDPLQMKGLDLTMRLQGADMAELFPIFGIALPPSPPYDVRGHLTYNEEAKDWRFTDFAGKMGDSDLSGDAIWDTKQERPKFTANFTSKRLDFKDLGGFIGAAPEPVSAGKRSAEQVEKKQEQEESPYVLPDAPLDISRLSAMDAQVEFTGKQVRSTALPLDDFYLKASLDNKLLTLTPVKFGTANGDVSAQMTINARVSPVKIEGDFTFRKLSLARLFEKMEIGDPANNRGYIGGVAKLKGTGKSLRDMLSTSNGTIGIGMEGGELSNLLIALMGLDIAKSLGFLLSGDEPVKIRCIIGDFAVKDGIMQSNALVIDTEESNVQGAGTINLKNEEMNVTIEANPKDVSALSLRAPLYITGTLKHPDVAIDPAVLVARGGVAATLSAVLTPLAAWVGFIDPGLGEDSDCAQLIKDMQAYTGKKGKASQILVNP